MATRGVRRMGQILQFIRARHPSDALDPDTLEVLGAAYDQAIEILQARDVSASVREVIASRIIDAATNGERDADALQTIALHGLY
jgi:hypothetical protein